MHLFFATFFRSCHITWRHEKSMYSSTKKIFTLLLCNWVFGLFGNNYIKEIKIDPLKILWLTVDLWSPWWSSSFLPQRQHHHDLYQPNVKFLREFLDLIKFYETFQVELVRRCKLNTQWPPTTRRYRFFLLLNHLVAHYGSLKIEKALDISHKWKVCLIKN